MSRDLILLILSVIVSVSILIVGGRYCRNALNPARRRALEPFIYGRAIGFTPEIHPLLPTARLIGELCLAAMAGIAVLGLGFVYLAGEFKTAALIKNEARSTTGIVTDLHRNSGKGTRYEVSFTFNLPEGDFSVIDAEIISENVFNSLQLGQSIPVLYAASNPALACFAEDCDRARIHLLYFIVALMISTLMINHALVRLAHYLQARRLESAGVRTSVIILGHPGHRRKAGSAIRFNLPGRGNVKCDVGGRAGLNPGEYVRIFFLLEDPAILRIE